MKKINWAEEIRISTSKIIRNGIEELNNSGINRDILIHNSRKRVKTIRAILKLIKDELSGKKYKEFNLTFRNLNRRSANIRRAYVMLEIIEKERKIKSDAVSLRLLDKIKNNVEELMISTQPKINVNQVLVQYSDLFYSFEKYFNSISFKKKDFLLLKNGFAEIYSNAKYHIKEANKSKDVVIYHELRKNVKDLSSMLEIIQKAWPDVIKSYNKQLKILADFIGEMHDLFEFNLLLDNANIPENMTKSKKLLQDELTERIHTLIIAVQELTNKIFAEKTECFISRFENIARFKLTKSKFHIA
ncbi:MAG: CHAD domain-containing protein [Ignavibacteriaceae bacterium]|nr:CHAD domain-containing protein [Ignavibacteriaceae bacterium]